MRYLHWLPVKGGQEVLESWAKVWKLPRVLVFSAVALLAYGSQALVFAWFCDVAGAGLGGGRLRVDLCAGDLVRCSKHVARWPWSDGGGTGVPVGRTWGG